MGGNGAAAGDAGQQGQQQGGEQQQGGPDIGAFAQQLEALGPQLEQQRQSLQAVTDWIGQQQQAEQGQEGEGEPLLDLSQIDPEFAYRPEDQQQQIQQGIQSALQDMVQRELGPLQEQMQQDRIEREATQLVQEYPEIGEHAEEIVGLAEQYARQYFPPQLAEQIKGLPGWWRATYLMGRGVEAANREGAGESAQAATLEGGGGAAPAGGNQRQGPYFQSPNDQGSGRLPF
jgi:hypothetical protein